MYPHKLLKKAPGLFQNTKSKKCDFYFSNKVKGLAAFNFGETSYFAQSLPKFREFRQALKYISAPALVVAVLFSGQVSGQLSGQLSDQAVSNPAQARDSITLNWALQQTQAHNAELAAYPYRLRQAQALVEQAGVRPNPELSLSVENAYGSGEYSNLDAAEISLTLSQTIELGGKRQQRLQYAGAEMMQQEAEYQLTRLDVLAETSRRYYQLLALQAKIEVNTQRQRQEAVALSSIEQRAKAGAIGQADVAKMALRQAHSQDEGRRLQNAQALAKLRLAAMWQGDGRFSLAEGDLSQLPPIPSRAQVAGSVEHSPNLLNQLALQRLSDANLNLAKAEGRSDMNIGIGVRQFEASNDQALLLDFSMPLAFSNPNRGRIKAAQAEAERNSSQQLLLRRQLQLSLLEVRQQLVGSSEQAQRLQQTLLPLAQTLLSETRKGYQQGRYSVLQWVDAQAELFAVEQKLINTQQQAFEQLLELERITGSAMTATYPISTASQAADTTLNNEESTHE